MNQTNIWKKRLNSKSDKKSNKIINSSNFKSKKRQLFSNSLKENLITNWIENEENESFINVPLFYKHFQVESNDEDEDSLHIQDLQRLSTMKNIIFLDLENFSSFFQYLTENLPNETYIIAFHSPNIEWKSPEKFL